MANEMHLYCTIVGGYSDADLQEETWQTGFRMFLGIGLTSPEDIGTLSQDVNIVPETHARVETAWNIDGNWSASNGAGAFDPADFLNDQIAPAVVTWLGTTSSPSLCEAYEVNLYPIGSDGRAIPAPPYAVGSPCKLTFTGAFPDGGGTNALPLQVSAVQSLRTGQLGRRGRGRMYRPALSAGRLLSNGTIGSSAASAMATETAALLAAVDFDPSVPPGPYVRPIVTGSPWTNYAVVKQVQVDQIADTQRRRNKSITRVYESASV